MRRKASEQENNKRKGVPELGKVWPFSGQWRGLVSDVWPVMWPVMWPLVWLRGQ